MHKKEKEKNKQHKMTLNMKILRKSYDQSELTTDKGLKKKKRIREAKKRSPQGAAHLFYFF